MSEKTKPLTRAELLAELTSMREAFGACHREKQAFLDQAKSAQKESRSQIDDLKQRLAVSEAECQRMRGYLARVQEDDTVREPLIRTGDPDGQSQLVPKRKPTAFPEPYPLMSTGMMATDAYAERHRPPPKHWVTY